MKRFALSSAGLLCALACVSAVPAFAQNAAPAAPTQQQAPRDIDPNTLANAAASVLQGFDAGKAGDLWDGASVVAKRAAKRADFIDHVAKARKPLGPPVERNWMAVRRQQVAGGTQLPPGTYASIEFVTRFQNNRVARELVSLRLDEDRIWRFAGYVIE